jgi:alkylation response protein AidB-like acyl-CoA dehydrogenase
MDFAFTEEQTAIQDMALDFAKEQIAPHALEWDETDHFPVDVIRQTAELGMGAIYVPEDRGGSGLKRLDGAIIFEALSYGCPTVAAYISIHNMVAWMVSKYASDAQRERWLPKLAAMEWLSSYCLTEPHCGRAASRPSRSRRTRRASASAPTNARWDGMRSPRARSFWKTARCRPKT